MLYMLIQVCDDTMEMAQHIHDMRVYIRKEETDIRSNNKICIKLWNFIDTVMSEYDDSFQPPVKGRATRSSLRKNARDDDYVPPGSRKRVRISEK
jgi:hypothetical protein